MVSSPALIAGLPAPGALGCGGPPLLASPAGSSSGLVLQNEVPVAAVHVPFAVGGVPVQSESAEHPRPGKSPPTQWKQLVPPKPHVVPSSMLLPPSVGAVTKLPTPQFPPEVLLPKMLLVTVAVPSFEMAPPLTPALLA